jgi:hydroxymethylglutaryl-CoA lyase
MAEHVSLNDVSLRDGLQDEPKFVAAAEKAAIARALISANVEDIEATSFVHPKWVPQLADAEEFVSLLPRGARYSALIMNARGIDRAVKAFDAAGFARGDYDLIFVSSASPRHNTANNNRTIEETMALFDEVAAIARREHVRLHGAIACAFVSPWREEPIDPANVELIARRYVAGGCSGLTLADTVGRADPRTVAERVEHIGGVVHVPLTLHLHDSFGYALANVYAGLERGVRRFDVALAGLGGCPWAPGAPGNLDTLKLADFLSACGFETGIDRERLASAADQIGAALERAQPIEREHAAIR